MKKIIILALVIVGVFSSMLFAEEAQKGGEPKKAEEAKKPEEDKKIQDNSYLLEEAYNQEAGVVQHISSFQYKPKSKDWIYTFTQEWPVPRETHQLSVTLPIAYSEAGSKSTGLGDVLLNYRYQLVQKDHIAMAPRLSLILPTGDYKTLHGTGALGFQLNIPISVELTDKFVTHWNMGATYTPGSKDPTGNKADTLAINYGASVIHLTTENFNLMCELVGQVGQSVQPLGATAWDNNSFYVSPGVRYAFNFKSGLQIVPGLAFPIGVGPSSGDNQMWFYLSFEHPMFHVAAK